MGKFVSRMGGRRTVVVSLCLLAAFLVWSILRADKVQVYRVERRDLVETVLASGRVRPLSRVRLGASIFGIVREVRAREGDSVRSGQELITVDDAEARGAVAQAEAALAEAEARLEQTIGIEREMSAARERQAEVTLGKAEADFTRASDLHKEGFVSDEQLESARQNLAVARSAYEVARLEAQSLDDNGAERRRAEATLAQARGSLVAARARLDYTRILAPDDGVVLTRDVEPGDTVQPGQVLMEMSLRAPTQLAAEPNEKNLAVLAPGQPALASADAFPDERFPARVIYVSPSVDAERGTIEVRLAVDDPPGFLRPDMTVSVEIEVARREGVFAVPVDVVREPTSRTPWVMALRDGRLERRDVRLGARGEDWIEVVEGLGEGDWVVPSTVRGVTLGQRARPQAITSRVSS